VLVPPSVRILSVFRCPRVHTRTIERSADPAKSRRCGQLRHAGSGKSGASPAAPPPAAHSVRPSPGALPQIPPPGYGGGICVSVSTGKGQAVACTILGERTHFVDVPFFWSQHYAIASTTWAICWSPGRPSRSRGAMPTPESLPFCGTCRFDGLSSLAWQSTMSATASRDAVEDRRP